MRSYQSPLKSSAAIATLAFLAPLSSSCTDEHSPRLPRIPTEPAWTTLTQDYNGRKQQFEALLAGTVPLDLSNNEVLLEALDTLVQLHRRANTLRNHVSLDSMLNSEGLPSLDAKRTDYAYGQFHLLTADSQRFIENTPYFVLRLAKSVKELHSTDTLTGPTNIEHYQDCAIHLWAHMTEGVPLWRPSILEKQLSLPEGRTAPNRPRTPEELSVPFESLLYNQLGGSRLYRDLSVEIDPSSPGEGLAYNEIAPTVSWFLSEVASHGKALEKCMAGFTIAKDEGVSFSESELAVVKAWIWENLKSADLVRLAQIKGNPHDAVAYIFECFSFLVKESRHPSTPALLKVTEMLGAPLLDSELRFFDTAPPYTHPLTGNPVPGGQPYYVMAEQVLQIMQEAEIIKN